MKTKTVLLALCCLVLSGMAGGGWWWWQAGQRQREIVAALPSIPDLSNMPPALRERLDAADARAHGRFSAAQGLVELSRLYHANGFPGEASQCYRSLQQLFPTEPRWPHLLATILAGYGEVEPGLELWQRVVTLAPDYLPARLRVGDCQLKMNQPDAAAATYAEVLKRSPDNAYALLGLARLDFEANRLEKARERLEALVTKTNYTLGYDLIVSLYERMGLTQRATAVRAMAKASGAYRDPADPWLDELIDDCFEPYRLSLTAGFVAGRGEKAEAVRLLERAVEIAPEDVSVRFQLGTLLVERNQLEAAYQQLERCTILAPDFSDGWAHLSSLQARLGQTTTAERTLATGLKNCPKSPGLHLMLARNLHRANRLGEAILEFQTAIQLRPNEADASIELGNLLISLGREAEAIQEMTRALQAEPGNPVALSILAFHAITSGDEAEARRWVARVRNQPRIPTEQLSRLLAAYQKRFDRMPW